MEQAVAEEAARQISADWARADARLDELRGQVRKALVQMRAEAAEETAQLHAGIARLEHSQTALAARNWRGRFGALGPVAEEALAPRERSLSQSRKSSERRPSTSRREEAFSRTASAPGAFSKSGGFAQSGRGPGAKQAPARRESPLRRGGRGP